MAENAIHISVDNKAFELALRNFIMRSPSNRRASLRKVGSLLLKEIRRKISGAGFTRDPGRVSKYPGVGWTGQLRRTAFMSVNAEGTRLVVGPREKYAVFLEFGTKFMPPRPFVKDTFEENIDRVEWIIGYGTVGPGGGLGS